MQQNDQQKDQKNSPTTSQGSTDGDTAAFLDMVRLLKTEMKAMDTKLTSVLTCFNDYQRKNCQSIRHQKLEDQVMYTEPHVRQQAYPQQPIFSQQPVSQPMAFHPVNPFYQHLQQNSYNSVPA